jgi:hypothetical protein
LLSKSNLHRCILGSVNKYTVQQHVKWWDNCVEAPNTYTIFNMDTQQALIRVEEQSDGGAHTS